MDTCINSVLLKWQKKSFCYNEQDLAHDNSQLKYNLSNKICKFNFF